MAPTLKQGVDEKEFARVIKTLEAIKADIERVGFVSPENFEAFRKVQEKWVPRMKDMSPEQNRKFGDLYQAILSNLTPEQKDDLQRVRSRGPSVVTREPITFLPSPMVPKKAGMVGPAPPVGLAPNITQFIPDLAKQATIRDLAGKGLVADLTGDTATAIKLGTQLADIFQSIGDANLRDMLGPNYQAVLDDLRKGNIRNALRPGQLLSDLAGIIDNIRVERPVFVFSQSGESPRVRLSGKSDLKLYVAGTLGLDLLVTETYKLTLKNQETMEIGAERVSTGNVPVLGGKPVVTVGPKFTLQMRPGFELSLTTSAQKPFGFENSPFVIGSFQLELKDVTGRNPGRILGNHPIYYSLLAEAQTTGAVRVRGAVGTTVASVGPWTFVGLFQGEGWVHGQPVIPTAKWSLSPAVLASTSSHQLGLRGIFGESVAGGGFIYTYQPRGLTFGFDITKTEGPETIEALRKFPGGITGATYLKVDLK